MKHRSVQRVWRSDAEELENGWFHSISTLLFRCYYFLCLPGEGCLILSLLPSSTPPPPRPPPAPDLSGHCRTKTRCTDSKAGRVWVDDHLDDEGEEEDNSNCVSTKKADAFDKLNAKDMPHSIPEDTGCRG